MSRLRRLAALALLALVVEPGCVRGLLRRPPEKQRFMIRLADPSAVAAPVSGVLRVDRVRVSPVFDSKGFVYRTGENSFDSDFYNEFFSPPGVLLREALVQWLASAQLFAAIDRGSAPEPDWVLETEVEQLYADQRKPRQPQGFLAVAFRVVDARTRKPQFEKRYSSSQPAADASPAALVDAWNRALAAVLGELGRDLGGALARPRAGAAR